MSKIDFLGIGDAVIDSFIELEDAWIEQDNPQNSKELCMRFGDKIPYREIVNVIGTGNAINASHAAMKLGLKTGVVSNVGTDDDGEQIIKTLTEKNIDTTHIKKHGDKKTNHNFILRFKEERTILVHHNHYKYSLPNDLSAEWIYLSSLAENSLPYHQEIIDFLKKNPNTKLIFQPGTFQIKLGKDKLAELYQMTHLFFCNKEEAQKILGTQEESIKILLDQIHQLGPKIVVITDGPRGAYVYDGLEFWRGDMYPDPAPPVDRTGAGDSFSATFAVYIIKGKTIKEALMAGPVNSASVVQYVGAQAGHLTEEEIDVWLSKAPTNYTPEKI